MRRSGLSEGQYPPKHRKYRRTGIIGKRHKTTQKRARGGLYHKEYIFCRAAQSGLLRDSTNASGATVLMSDVRPICTISVSFTGGSTSTPNTIAYCGSMAFTIEAVRRLS